LKVQELRELVAGTDLALVAESFLSNSQRFLVELFIWISREYNALVLKMGTGSEGSVWKYISQGVKAIFKALYKIRRFGQIGDPAEQSWYCLKSLQLQREIMDAKFTNHDIVQNVLHKHLRNDVVLKSIFQARVQKVDGEIKDIRRQL